MCSLCRFLFGAFAFTEPLFSYLMLGFFIDIYVGCGFGSIGENVDKPEEEEDTGGRK